MALGSSFGAILGVASFYFGIVVGRSSIKTFLDEFEIFIATLTLLLTDHRARDTFWSGVKQIKHDVSNYHRESDYSLSETNIDLWMVGRWLRKQLAWITLSTIVVFSMSILLTGQLISYRALPQLWLFIPPLLAIFGYSVGKYVGAAWSEIRQRPQCYELEIENRKEEFQQKRIQDYRDYDNTR